VDEGASCALHRQRHAEVSRRQPASGAPNFTLEITLKDDAAWVHPTSQATLRLWPETETDFFLKELDAQLSFVRDAQGAVTAVVLHQGGQDQTAPRVRTAG
jgi:hypothetical protein